MSNCQNELSFLPNWIIAICTVVSVFIAFLSLYLHRKTAQYLENKERPTLFISENSSSSELGIKNGFTYSYSLKNIGQHPAENIDIIIYTGLCIVGKDIEKQNTRRPTNTRIPVLYQGEIADSKIEWNYGPHMSTSTDYFILVLIIVKYRDKWVPEKTIPEDWFWRIIEKNENKPTHINDVLKKEYCFPFLQKIKEVEDSPLINKIIDREKENQKVEQFPHLS